MGEVRTEYANMESPRPFARQLAQLSQSLGLPLPMFKGRRLYTYGYGEDAWEITTFIFRDAALPNPAHLVYTKTYCNWGLGINLAIHEALSRQCHYARHLLPADSPYRDYGRRDEYGNIEVTPGDRNNMPPRRRHIEDMERENGALAEKVRFAAHLLEGPAASWWDTFQITHPLDTVTWAMFEEGFRTNHVSSGVLSLKRKEFRNLRQTNRTVAEYIEEFNILSRYAPEDVDTDAKRRERFLDGLSDELSVRLLVVYCPTFQELMDKARILAVKHKQVENRKRKSNTHHSGSPHKTRTSYDGYSKHGGSDHGSHDRRDGHLHDNHRSNHHNHKE